MNKNPIFLVLTLILVACGSKKVSQSSKLEIVRKQAESDFKCGDIKTQFVESPSLVVAEGCGRSVKYQLDCGKAGHHFEGEACKAFQKKKSAN